MAGLGNDMECRSRYVGRQLVRPVHGLPFVRLAPEDLNRQTVAESREPVVDFRRIPAVVVTNLMLEETRLPDGPRYGVQVWLILRSVLAAWLLP